ncbi:MAG: hypothetical protein K0Q78_1090, partial [Cellvibrio sp.]|nr:hypothetical protein [Cellvibrio sp.]
NGPMQGVYFSSNPEPTGQPDVIRLADTKKELANNGLLKSISKEDFQNTDVLVFRESTGQLYMQRKGLPDDELEYEGAADEDEGGQTGLGKDGKYFYYRLMVRGVMDLDIDFSGPEPKGGWNDWSTGYELEESFREHESNHLRSGEWVRIVVINRATGYMGTRRVQLNEASQNNNGMMSLPVDEIVLKPPQLKVWAERQFSIDHGAKQGTTQTNIVGAEGAALNDDEVVTVYTEWFDEEGRPLPEELGRDSGEEFGLTGRLARIVSDGQIAAVAQSNLAEFPIAPGVNTQVLQVNSNLSAAEHFYIHVSGTAKDESPQFDSGNTATGLAGRPKMLTPFLSPVRWHSAQTQSLLRMVLSP